MKKLFVLILVAAALTAAIPAQSQVSIVLDPDTISVNPGEMATYSGTLSNIGTESLTVYYTNISFRGDMGLFPNYDNVDNYSHLVLAGGESWTGKLFNITTNGNSSYPDVLIAPPGSYSGNFGLTWKYGDGVWHESQDKYYLNVTPEPTGLFALACGLSGLSGLLWRRKFRK